jgi:hypothetical protein
MKVFSIRPTGQRGIASLVFIAAALLIEVQPAHAQFGGTCGCPVIVSDPQMYGRQAEQLTQETRIADLAAQNTTTGDSGLWQSQLGFLNGLGSTMSQSGGLCYSSPNARNSLKQTSPVQLRRRSMLLNKCANWLRSLSGHLVARSAWRSSRRRISSMRISSLRRWNPETRQ